MDGTGLIVAGLIISPIAAVIVYFLYWSHLANMPTRRRRAVIAVALLVQVVVLLSDVSDRRNIALRLEKTESKLLQMEGIMQDYENHNQDVVHNLASMLSKYPTNIKKMSFNKARSPDGTENSELTVTMKDAHVDLPQLAADEDHTADEILKDPKLNDDEVPPSSHGDGIGEEKPKPWRVFSIPQDHVLFLDCEDDSELTVHIRPSTAEDDMDGGSEATRAGTNHACNSRQAGTAPFLSYRRTYHALFLPRSGEERFVPVPWPRAEMFQKVTDATLRGKEWPIVHEQAVPESFSLSPDVVAFYRRLKDGTTELVVAATEAVEHKELAEEEVVREMTALTPPTILPVSIPHVCIRKDIEFFSF